MRQSHIIISNASVIWISQALMLVPQLIFVPYLIGTIGERGYGIYALIWSLVMSVTGFEKSLQSGVIKHCAAFLAQGRMDDVNKILSSSFVYSMFLAIIALAATLLVALLGRHSDEGLAFPLFIVGLMYMCIFPIEPYKALIKAKQCYYVDSLLGVLAKYASLAMVYIWFTFVQPSVNALIVIVALILTASRFVQIPIAHRFVPSMKIRLSLFDKVSFRLIAVFGTTTVLASLCLAANTTGIRWLMGSLVSVEFVARLSIMLVPAALASGIISPIAPSLMPAASAYEATGNNKMIGQLLVRGMKYFTILALFASIAAAFLMEGAIYLWVGADYLFLAPYAMILLCSQLFRTNSQVAHQLLKGMGRLRVVVWVYFIGLVAVPFSGILIAIWATGNPYTAVVVGLASGNVITGFLNIAFCSASIGEKLNKVIIDSLVKPLLPAALAFLLVYLFISHFELGGLLWRIIAASVAIFLFLVQLCVFATNDEKTLAKELFARAGVQIRRNGRHAWGGSGKC